MQILKRIAPLLLSSLALLSAGCGGSASSTTVKQVVISPSSTGIVVNAQQAYTATGTDSAGNSVSGLTFTWVSSDTNVATIGSTGVATGKAGGTTQITATSDGVTSAPATLTVLPAIGSVDIQPTSASIRVGATQQFTATAKDVNGNPVSGATFSWSISFSGTATIDSNGLATAVAPGTVTVRANLGGINSPAATLTVTP